MFWFIAMNGLYFTGGKPEDESSWQQARNGAITFKTARLAQDRIDELGIEGAAPEEY